jgi:hypothetical protein
VGARGSFFQPVFSAFYLQLLFLLFLQPPLFVRPRPQLSVELFSAAAQRVSSLLFLLLVSVFACRALLGQFLVFTFRFLFVVSSIGYSHGWLYMHSVDACCVLCLFGRYGYFDRIFFAGGGFLSVCYCLLSFSFLFFICLLFCTKGFIFFTCLRQPLPRRLRVSSCLTRDIESCRIFAISAISLAFCSSSAFSFALRSASAFCCAFLLASSSCCLSFSAFDASALFFFL